MGQLRTLLAAAGAMRLGEVTPRQLVDECLDRIDRFDSQISAWVVVDREGARQTADRLTQELAAGNDLGPLHGIPIGIKDIIDVAGLPTRAGSAFTSDQPAAADATVVRRLRDAGAIILGKTVTTEFAWIDPPPTRNPWNTAHTPGGSSSGSAAALAMGMCYGAIGSQTGGSITRPASYCGVSGCKPTFGRVSRAGVVPFSFHLDHVGPMARSTADCGALLAAIAGEDSRDLATSVGPAFALLRGPFTRRPKLGVMRAYFLEQANREVAAQTAAAIDGLRDAGAEVIELELPAGFEKVPTMHRRIMASEAADFHGREHGAPRAGYGAHLEALLAEGRAISMADYQEALRHQLTFGNALDAALEHVDALVTPATPAPAPGPETTGDARFNFIWSHAGSPTVSFPFHVTASGLPIALQLVGQKWSESKLLATAAWCEAKMPFSAEPGILQTGFAR